MKMLSVILLGYAALLLCMLTAVFPTWVIGPIIFALVMYLISKRRLK